MNERSAQEQELFEAARKLTKPAHRAAFLEAACAGDAALRKRLEDLLGAQAEADDFFRPLPSPPLAVAAAPIAAEPMPDEHVGTMIGRYKLLQKIGEGGFGVVYLAEQKEPVKRRVALKIIKLGMDTKQVIARFEAERQALALMDHPNIARIYDGGMTGASQSEISNLQSEIPQGRPYFVMELVRGVPITHYCDENQLDTGERLQLFLQVCHAVQHAHQKGVIHRDLKPSNILVTINDGQAVPKVIDFGVAKATQQELTDKTIVTQFHHFIGTPAYVSPEQAAMTSLDIDTRSDIYALGVLLYELLTGKTPFDGKELLASGLDEMRRTIREKEPARPSTRLSTMTEGDRTTTARLRKTDSPKLIHQLRGDLDWIVMKCLEKDRNRRYETANGLAADIKRHLSNEPVVARPPSAAYQFRKLVCRHKLQFGAAIGISVVLVAGIVASSWQAIRARRAEQQQRFERGRAEKRFEATMGFFDTAFNDVAPTLGHIIGAAQPREQLASAAAKALEQLQQGDAPNATNRVVLGQLYLQLALSHGWFAGNTTGDYETAWHAVTNAIALFESAVTTSPGNDLWSRLSRAETVAGFISLGLLKPQDAIAHFQKCHQWASRAGDETWKNWARMNIGDVLLRTDRAEEALTNIFLPQLESVRKHGPGERSTNVLDVWDLERWTGNVGFANQQLRRYQDALPYLREALRLMEVICQRDPLSAQFSSTLPVDRALVGEVLLRLNQSEEGMRLLRDAAKEADDLAVRDPANAGFTQAQIEVAWRSAAGYAAWARDPAASSAERQARLDHAQAQFDRADTLLAGLKSDSLRKFLRNDMSRAEMELKLSKSKAPAASARENR